MRFSWGTLGVAAFLTCVGFLRAEDAPKPGEGAITQEQLKKQLLEKFDANGDGNLTGEELLKARDAVQNQLGAAAGVNIEELKKKFDRDGDGELNPQERAAAMAALQKARAGGGPVAGGIPAGGGFGGNGFGTPATGEGGKTRKPNPRVKRFDRDGDGKLSDDEKAEAQKELKGKKGEKPASKLTEAMKKFDTDGDGKLSDEEKAVAKKEKKEKGKKPE